MPKGTSVIYCYLVSIFLHDTYCYLYTLGILVLDIASIARLWNNHGSFVPFVAA
jgi:hypothetical protein